MSTTFLDNLKVGSQVMLSSMGGKIFPHIIGETNKYWIVSTNSKARFRKSDGKQVGGYTYLQEYNHEIYVRQYQERADEKESKELRQTLAQHIQTADLDTLRYMMDTLMSLEK